MLIVLLWAALAGDPMPLSTGKPVLSDATAPPPLEARAGARKIRLGGPAEWSGARPTFDTVDHSAWDSLLHRFVDRCGLVCYQEWKADCLAVAQLHQYLCQLGQTDTGDKQASSAAELAFYINTYNALTIWGILCEYPTPSIQRHNGKKASYRIFDDLELWLDGDYLSLNAIEHEILRTLGEPRIHFAIVCAARGCPRLRNEAYTAERLEEQLCENAIDFFASRERFRIDRLGKKVKMSPILKWFREDFGTTDGEVIATVFPYLPEDARQWLVCHPCARIHHLGYDWGLNDRCPTFGVQVGSLPYAIFAKVEPGIRPFLGVLRRPRGVDSSSPPAELTTATKSPSPAGVPEPPRALYPKADEPEPPRAIDPLPEHPDPPRAIMPQEAPLANHRSASMRHRIARGLPLDNPNASKAAAREGANPTR